MDPNRLFKVLFLNGQNKNKKNSHHSLVISIIQTCVDINTYRGKDDKI